MSNVTLPGTGASVATDTVGGVEIQVVKLDIGGAGFSVPVVGAVPTIETGDVRTLLETAVYLLAAILEKQPRLDGNDRLVTNPSEVAPSTTPVSGTLTGVTTVTSVTDVTRINSFGASATSRPADAVPVHLANAGAMHIYNMITVTP